MGQTPEDLVRGQGGVCWAAGRQQKGLEVRTCVRSLSGCWGTAGDTVPQMGGQVWGGGNEPVRLRGQPEVRWPRSRVVR